MSSGASSLLIYLSAANFFSSSVPQFLSSSIPQFLSSSVPQFFSSSVLQFPIPINPTEGKECCSS
ncbi:hypothetical protein FJ471_26120 [Mesorhizobium sp. B2-7-1]|nr:hypothetical protein FJ471_26120 [Mesorhizobium sp. B2-7-1]